VFDAKLVEKIKSYILWLVTFFLFFENLAIYEIMWKNILETGKLQMAIWRMRVAYWIPKATDTHSG